jgi:hypothetical protein
MTPRREFVLMLLAGLCALQAPTGCARRKGRPYRLPSGSEITITGTGRMYFSSEKAWALTLQYETQVPLSDSVALRAQAAEVMDMFKADVEKAGVKYGALTARTPSSGAFFGVSHGHNFLMEKDATGHWVLK